VIAAPALADPRWRLLSRTAEYALRAVLYLAVQRGDGVTGAADMAAALAVPERYLARVLNVLARRGVLTSSRGARGGFRLALHPSQLVLADIVAPFDAVGEAPQCLLRNQRCGTGEPCIAHYRWEEVAANVRAFFRNTTVEDLIAQHRGVAAPG
jgi:Rrf2 family protein